MGTIWRRAKGSRLAWAAAATVAAGFLAASCSPSSTPATPGAPAPASRSGAATHPSSVISVNAISTLRSLFNRADGRTRLVLILSPT
jgi:multidrug efflux pump subunit AcrA (membrane-fusion protein)